MQGSRASTPSPRLCFPPEEEYQARFFQATHQSLAGEEATPRNIVFALASGGYPVRRTWRPRQPRTLEGSARGQSDTTIRGHPVNAEAAKFSPRRCSRDLRPRPHLRLSLRRERRRIPTDTSAEMTTCAGDGFVPYVMGSPESIPNCFTARVNAFRVLKASGRRSSMRSSRADAVIPTLG